MLSSRYKRHSKILNGVSVQLTTRVRGNQVENWSDLKDGEYIFLNTYSSDEHCGIIFKCPGCSDALCISLKDHKNEPGWKIDFEKLTATPSILHSRDGRGCGWHGYLTDGLLKPC